MSNGRILGPDAKFVKRGLAPTDVAEAADAITKAAQPTPQPAPAAPAREQSPLSLTEARATRQERGSGNRSAPTPPPAAHPTKDAVSAPWLKDAKVLDRAEYNAYREPLFKAFRAMWRGLDEGMSETNKAGVRVGGNTFGRGGRIRPIWGGIDNEETYVVVDALLDAGAKNPAAAVAVRTLNHVWSQVQVGVVLLPRFYETYRFYAQFGIGMSPPGDPTYGAFTPGTQPPYPG